MEEFSIDKNGGQEFTTGKKQFLKDSTYSNGWRIDKKLKGNTKCKHPVNDEDLANEYVFEFQEGIKCEKKSISFRITLVWWHSDVCSP